MRFFLGTLLSSQSQDLYARFIARLTAEHRVLRSIPARTAHITYAFSARSSASIDEILSAIRPVAARQQARDIHLEAPHVLMAGPEPRLVCAGLRGDPEAVGKLSADLVRALVAAFPGLDVTPTKSPHVTLVRFRKGSRRADGVAVTESLARESGTQCDDRIDSVQLIESELTPDGPRYTVRGTVGLATSSSTC